MGLDVSHGAFQCPYGRFNALRQAVAAGVGVKFPPHNEPGLEDNSIYWHEGFTQEHPGLATFLLHSDCDGELSPEECRIVAKELEAITDAIIDPDDWIVSKVKLFISSAREAAIANEPLVFQ